MSYYGELQNSGSNSYPLCRSYPVIHPCTKWLFFLRNRFILGSTVLRGNLKHVFLLIQDSVEFWIFSAYFAMIGTKFNWCNGRILSKLASHYVFCVSAPCEWYYNMVIGRHFTGKKSTSSHVYVNGHQTQWALWMNGLAIFGL